MFGPILPVVVMILGGGAIFVAERLFPGRELPEAPGWYARALAFNIVDILVIMAAGWLYNDYFRAHALFPIQGWHSTPLEVLFLWLAWSFVFYWWHRAAHLNGLWHVFHQMHHSPSRIETATTFYKHPIESVWETFLTAFVLYFVFGASAEAGGWLGTIVVIVGYTSHANLRTPKWLGYFVQRPEQHSIHHQLDLHRYNYADFIWWDRIFGTFKEAEEFTPRCGFPKDHERRVREILLFKDVYN